MKILLVLSLCCIFLHCHGQEIIDKSCSTNVQLTVAIDTVYANMDSVFKRDTTWRGQVDYRAFCNPCFKLRPLNEKYKVVSFVITSERNDGYIIERKYTGNIIDTSHGLVEIGASKQNSTVLITCILALHANGNIYTLRSISIRR